MATELPGLALFAPHPRLIELDTSFAADLVAERFTGREAVCADFRFQVDCLSPSALLDVQVLIGEAMTVRLNQADGRYRRWHGYCTQASPLGSNGGLARYRLTMEPWTAFLRLRRNALIFQDRDAIGVLERVFADHAQAAWRVDVTDTLPSFPVTTQYRESDHAFVFRLLAAAGLAWRFEHAQQGDGTDAGHCLVVFDRQADWPPAQPPVVRFHRSDATEKSDAISHFSERRQATANAFTTAAWHAEQVEAVSATVSADPAGPHLPTREVLAVPRAGRFAERAHAERHGHLQLDALRLPAQLYVGGGSAALAAGAAFTLTQHSGLSGQGFVPLAVEHVAANNASTAHGGTQAQGILELLSNTGIERGSYRNRFLAVTADTPVVPLDRAKPTAPGAQTARVVGLPGAAVTSNRDHQVRIQFPWQRGSAPNPGGLTETGSSIHPDGHAPGDASSGTWVRVAEWLAGASWGSHALPRVGSEVLVEFLHGDIDQPVVVGQLYNGEAGPPFALAEASNHPGTLSGLHTQSLDGGGTQQWLLDDAPGQLRQRLHTSLADSRLELGYLIDPANGARGGLRGEGFDLATLGWANVRAGQGILLSTTTRLDAASTQLDSAEAVSQLKGAERTAQALSDAAQDNEVAPLAANREQSGFIAIVDPDQDGHYAGDINGQSATRPAHSGRDGGSPVERFADPVLLVESPDAIAMTTPKSALAYAGGNVHLTVQDDAHLAAGCTVAGVAGAHLALFAQRGPVKAIAGNGPLSLQAHSGTLELLADQSVSVTATDERIEVLASTQIVLQAGQTQVTLEGGDITFACPGNFTVKAAQMPFAGRETNPAIPDHLPHATTVLPRHFAIRLKEQFGQQPLSGKPYRLELGSTVYEGTIPGDGVICHEIPPRARKGYLTSYPFGEENGPWSWALDLGAQQQTDKHEGLQSRLKNLGFYHGVIDGDFGPKSRAALQRFYRAVDIAGKSTPTKRGVVALGGNHDV